MPPVATAAKMPISHDTNLRLLKRYLLLGTPVHASPFLFTNAALDPVNCSRSCRGPRRAGAAPTNPTLSLAKLQAKLAASPTGTVDGYFLTAVKGATIASIPCVIEGVVPQAAYDNGDLILFEAGGPVIDQAGGIAAGMSGSPVYVSDGGIDKLVGAVSYGEYDTIGGRAPPRPSST